MREKEDSEEDSTGYRSNRKWGREAMSMCRGSQESACAADLGHLAERRCL